MTTRWCRVTLVAADGAELAAWDVTSRVAPDLALVDRLARLCLRARQEGAEMVLSDVAPRLRELLELVGLAGDAGLIREMGRQPEDREEALGVEEAMEAGDPPA